MELCELCRFHPATHEVVTAAEDGTRRTVAVCSVHRRLAEHQAVARPDEQKSARAVSGHPY